MGIPWMNPDGLFQKFGVDEAAISQAGEVPAAGIHRLTEVRIDLTKLATATQLILADTVFAAKNARIEEVEVEVETGATSGGAATLDVGAVRNDRTTELDFDGFVAAAAVATIDTAGKRLNLIRGSTGAGALIGTTLANPGYLVAKAGTAVFTAGVLKVRVKYYFI
jgi:hypothetical protein